GREEHDDEGGEESGREARVGVKTEPAKIRCARCGVVVTDEDERIAPLGLHVHECTNPAGVKFRVACFARAVNVHVVTNPSREWSWFPGFAWQIEHCDGCDTHIGWRYTRGE